MKNISIFGKGTIDGNEASFKVDPIENDDELRNKDVLAYDKTMPILIRMLTAKTFFSGTNPFPANAVKGRDAIERELKKLQE